MRIAIYGATGNVGSRIVTEAAGRGHAVTALSRHEPTIGYPAGVTWQAGDLADTAQVERLAAEHDVIVSAVGPSRVPGGDPAAFADLIAAAATAVGRTRFAVVGGAGSLRGADGGRLVDLADFPEPYRPEALAQSDALDRLRAAGDELDWVYLSPAPEIGPGERTGAYVTGDDSPAGSWVSFEDYAVALVDELENRSHVRTRFTVAAAG